MNEVIDSILKAEDKAAKILAAANEEVKNDLLATEEKAEGIKAAAINAFKAERKAALNEAENKAAALYNAKIEEGKKDGEALKAQAEANIDGVVDALVGRIIG